jgi:hypothetical protein
MARRKTQQTLPTEGMEAPYDEELSDQAQLVADLTEQRLDVHGKEMAERERLVEMMGERGLEKYVDPDAELTVKLRKGTKAPDKVSVNKLKKRAEQIVQPEAVAAE